MTFSRPDSIEPSLAPNRFGLLAERFGGLEGEDTEWDIEDEESSWKVLIPKGYTANAAKVIGTRYLSQGDCTSWRELVHLVCDTIAAKGEEAKYFDSIDEAQVFADELKHLVLQQLGTFNSPVWFNVGRMENPQTSACFLTSIEDSLLEGPRSIMDIARIEASIFKYGSGSGLNASKLRGEKEPLKNGGTSSGPMGFVNGLDRMAQAIKSGGRTRRAAKIVTLDSDHPDIFKFIDAKVDAERRAQALIDAGFPHGFDDDDSVYRTVPFQNANHSVRMTDEFMHAFIYSPESEVFLRRRTDNQKIPTGMNHLEFWDRIAGASWECGDPGIQFDGTTNWWNTVPHVDRINTSNPCAEYTFIDNTSCNLGHLFISKFLREDGSFLFDLFEYCAELVTTAMDIIVGFASYPTTEIHETTRLTRPISLGYTGMGAALVEKGIPYGSDEAVSFVGAVTSFLQASAIKTSAKLAKRLGAYPALKRPEGKRNLTRIVMAHHKATEELLAGKIMTPEARPAKFEHLLNFEPSAELIKTFGPRLFKAWRTAITMVDLHGSRNAFTSCLAPTGTTSFQLDSPTTGIEPILGLVQQKTLVGGGVITIVPECIKSFLQKTLPGHPEVVASVEECILESGTIPKDYQEVLNGVSGNMSAGKWDHIRRVLRTSFGSDPDQVLLPTDHLRVMAAAQPFLSGAISKTVNVPRYASKEDISKVYVDAWALGLKSLAVYRDGCKRSQPIEVKGEGLPQAEVESLSKPRRRKPPTGRYGTTYHLRMGGVDGYITINNYPVEEADDYEEAIEPCEVFIRLSKVGSTISGMCDVIGILMSLSLQYGVPIETIARKLKNTQFEPSGFLAEPIEGIRSAGSITDFLGKLLETLYIDDEECGSCDDSGTFQEVQSHKMTPDDFSGRVCNSCGSSNMVQTGTCWICGSCFVSTGCE